MPSPPSAPPSAEPFGVAILAGGRARRLGGLPKGLLRVGGRPVLEHLLAQLPGTPPVVLVANEPWPYASFRLPAVGDLEPGRGVPGGVVTGLWATAAPWVLVLACDMPGITREAIATLLDARSPEVDVVCFHRQGELEPLLGVYRRALFRPWAAALAHNPSLRGLVQGRPHRALPAPHQGLLDSLNTPEDLLRLGAARP